MVKIFRPSDLEVRLVSDNNWHYFNIKQTNRQQQHNNKQQKNTALMHVLWCLTRYLTQCKNFNSSAMCCFQISVWLGHTLLQFPMSAKFAGCVLIIASALLPTVNCVCAFKVTIEIDWRVFMHLVPVSYTNI